jgi:hypothetical protein
VGPQDFTKWRRKTRREGIRTEEPRATRACEAARTYEQLSLGARKLIPYSNLEPSYNPETVAIVGRFTSILMHNWPGT